MITVKLKAKGGHEIKSKWLHGKLVDILCRIYVEYTEIFIKIDRIWSRFTKEINMWNTFPTNPVYFSSFPCFKKRRSTTPN